MIVRLGTANTPTATIPTNPHPPRPKCEQRRVADPVARLMALAKGSVQRPARTQVERGWQRRKQHSHDAAREGQDDGARLDHRVFGHREGDRQITGDFVEDGPSQNRACDDACQRSGDAQQERLEGKHEQDLAWREALRAQHGDEPATLGHGEQHCVQREQKPDDRADRGEQCRRVAARCGGLVQQLEFVICRTHVDAPRPERAELTCDMAFGSRLRSDEHFRDPSGKPCKPLDQSQRRDRYGTGGDRPDEFFAENPADGRFVGGAGCDDLDPVVRVHPHPHSESRGKTDSARQQHLGDSYVPRRRGLKRGEGRGNTDELDGLAASGWTDDRGVEPQHRRRCLDIRQCLRAGCERFAETSLGARGELQASRPDDGVDELGLRACDTRVGDQHTEEQRDARRYPCACKQLLHRIAAQVPPVEPQQ